MALPILLIFTLLFVLSNRGASLPTKVLIAVDHEMDNQIEDSSKVFPCSIARDGHLIELGRRNLLNNKVISLSKTKCTPEHIGRSIIEPSQKMTPSISIKCSRASHSVLKITTTKSVPKDHGESISKDHRFNNNNTKSISKDHRFALFPMQAIVSKDHDDSSMKRRSVTKDHRNLLLISLDHQPLDNNNNNIAHKDQLEKRQKMDDPYKMCESFPCKLDPPWMTLCVNDEFVKMSTSNSKSLYEPSRMTISAKYPRFNSSMTISAKYQRNFQPVDMTVLPYLSKQHRFQQQIAHDDLIAHNLGLKHPSAFRTAPDSDGRWLHLPTSLLPSLSYNLSHRRIILWQVLQTRPPKLQLYLQLKPLLCLSVWLGYICCCRLIALQVCRNKLNRFQASSVHAIQALSQLSPSRLLFRVKPSIRHFVRLIISLAPVPLKSSKAKTVMALVETLPSSLKKSVGRLLHLSPSSPLTSDGSLSKLPLSSTQVDCSTFINGQAIKTRQFRPTRIPPSWIPSQVKPIQSKPSSTPSSRFSGSGKLSARSCHNWSKSLLRFKPYRFKSLVHSKSFRYVWLTVPLLLFLLPSVAQTSLHYQDQILGGCANLAKLLASPSLSCLPSCVPFVSGTYLDRDVLPKFLTYTPTGGTLISSVTKHIKKGRPSLFWVALDACLWRFRYLQSATVQFSPTQWLVKQGSQSTFFVALLHKFCAQPVFVAQTVCLQRWPVTIQYEVLSPHQQHCSKSRIGHVGNNTSHDNENYNIQYDASFNLSTASEFFASIATTPVQVHQPVSSEFEFERNEFDTAYHFILLTSDPAVPFTSTSTLALATLQGSKVRPRPIIQLWPRQGRLWLVSCLGAACQARSKLHSGDTMTSGRSSFPPLASSMRCSERSTGNKGFRIPPVVQEIQTSTWLNYKTMALLLRRGVPTITSKRSRAVFGFIQIPCKRAPILLSFSKICCHPSQCVPLHQPSHQPSHQFPSTIFPSAPAWLYPSHSFEPVVSLLWHTSVIRMAATALAFPSEQAHSNKRALMLSQERWFHFHDMDPPHQDRFPLSCIATSTTRSDLYFQQNECPMHPSTREAAQLFATQAIVTVETRTDPLPWPQQPRTHSDKLHLQYKSRYKISLRSALSCRSVHRTKAFQDPVIHPTAALPHPVVPLGQLQLGKTSNTQQPP